VVKGAWFISRRDAEAQRLGVFCGFTVCFEAVLFAELVCEMLQFNWKAIYNQDCHPVAKRDLMNGSSYAIKVSRRDAETRRRGVFCGFTVGFEAVCKHFIYASPYVFLCDLMWFISRKGAKLAKTAGFLCLCCML